LNPKNKRERITKKKKISSAYELLKLNDLPLGKENAGPTISVKKGRNK
jgi:hypothetical protein